ncbi:MAG: Glu-tRNA(Gln) amidotransferase subunit GatE [Nanoarchaeota archaeon]|nr:Glu-tRNA(Gln) amidotransferase subunit GatE [DPANN group archaeon]MBL7116298.1 Glu-tRNA(Gln) amidotransferase subunit GatE [Nanoarchaeota archaeon]
MAKIDYNKIGFKCGIEVHQQLEGKKLFCNCPTEIRKDKPDFTFDRRLRASAGESGEVDVAASYEQQKNKLFTYWAYDDVNCLVEMDEEPPEPINQEALKTTIQVARMLNCELVDKIQVMRKTVVDGSNTSGFQRTALVGRNGFVEMNKKKIGIPTVCLEEEACQVMKRTKDHDVYNLSRLGIPLIEIATDPDIGSPEECREVAAKIGMILRSTGACKRGIGSIRQDVNISIKRGARTEIKGFQDLRSIPKVIDNEIKRQQELIKKKKKINKEVRKAESDFTTSYLRPMPGAARMYPETDIETIIPKEVKFEKIETMDDRIKRYKKNYGLNDDLAKLAVKFENKEGFVLEGYFKKYKDAKFVVQFFTSTPKELKKRYNVIIDPRPIAEKVLDKVSSEELPKGSVVELLADYGKTKKLNFGKFKGISTDKLEKEIKKIVEKNKGAPVGALMGIIMGKFRGKVDGKQAMKILKKHHKF